MNENKLYLHKHFIVYDKSTTNEQYAQQIDDLKSSFCGNVITDLSDINLIDNDAIIYIHGDIKELLRDIHMNYKQFYVIKELSSNYQSLTEKINCVNLGEVPINVHNVGVMFKRFFSREDYFHALNNEHEFQDLTESTKPTMSYRKGIYLSKVKETKEGTHFNMLRCSTNLGGPTENFRQTDTEIVDKVQQAADKFFDQKVDLNHVLAQIYNNTTIDGKEKKAKIKDHSDKTKDMPQNGLIVFCTFYNLLDVDLLKFTKQEDDPYDIRYKGKNSKILWDKKKNSHLNPCDHKNTVLTRLRFRLKTCVENSDDKLVQLFDVTLYPNSVFIITLEINRLYTHEIVPSAMINAVVPTRLGYVIRCSNRDALFKNGQTLVKNNLGEYVELEPSTPEGFSQLKKQYSDENRTDKIIEYEEVNFSMNKGDYTKPTL